MDGRYVIAGGSGAGKTTVIEGFKRIGYEIVPEAATIVINEALSKGLPHPSHNLEQFVHDVIRKDCELETHVSGYHPTLGKQPVFYDRTYLDAVAYAEMANISIDSELMAEAQKQTFDTIFFFDLLPQFQSNEVQNEDPEARITAHKAIRKIYERTGIPIVNVPVTDPSKRCAFILEHLAYST